MNLVLCLLFFLVLIRFISCLHYHYHLITLSSYRYHKVIIDSVCLSVCFLVLSLFYLLISISQAIHLRRLIPFCAYIPTVLVHGSISCYIYVCTYCALILSFFTHVSVTKQLPQRASNSGGVWAVFPCSPIVASLRSFHIHIMQASSPLASSGTVCASLRAFVGKSCRDKRS